MKPGDIVHWRDIEVTLRVVKLDNSWFEWQVFEIVGEDWASDEDTSKSGRLMYHLKGYKSSSDDTADINEAEPLLSGVVKWDGCAHLDFAPDRGGYVHVCGARDADRIGKVIRRLYDVAAEHMPGFDREVADYEPRPAQ